MNWKFWRKKNAPPSLTKEQKLFLHSIQMQPRLGAGASYEIGICSDPNCEWHKEDGRFIFGRYGSWTLKEEIWKEGARKKEEYFKKYGDYGPARGRPENFGLMDGY
jgi:hypothetical protein